ncbi:hypothetical protein [Niallia taxi]|nr:hypothetical protein [Niallia taxi]
MMNGMMMDGSMMFMICLAMVFFILILVFIIGATVYVGYPTANEKKQNL